MTLPDLGYGTPGLMGVETRQERLALLERAVEAGIRHFDTSPYYGYGVVEPLLGEFLAVHGGGLTVTSKFGIQPPPPLARSSFVMGLARKIAALSPGIKRLLSRGASKMVRSGAFDPAEAQRSLAASQRNLQRDHLDFYLLHEPAVADATPALQQVLEQAVADGRIGAFGTGASGPRAEEIARSAPAFARVLQFDAGSDGRRVRQLAAAERRLFAYGSVGAGVRAIRERLAQPGEAARWREALALDPADELELGGALLALAVRKNAGGCVLFATRDAARLRQNVRAVRERLHSEQTLQQLESFLQPPA